MNRLLAILVVVALVLPAHARLLADWPYERLLKDADVVVIAEAMAAEDTGETTQDNPWKVDFVGVSTKFAVKTVLKGKVEGDTLTVLHYRIKPDVLVRNGPLLVSFRLKGIEVRTKTSKMNLGKPHYLLFLKKRKDGRFEPLSGQIDPVLSVREMYEPLRFRPE